MTTWADIPIFPGYQASDDGQVRNEKRVIPRHRHCCGYVVVNLRVNKRTRTQLVHRLVGMAHLPNPLGRPFINHKDGDRTNNDMRNLEWVTALENTAHAIHRGSVQPRRFGRMIARLSPETVIESRRLSASGASYKAIGRQMGVSGSAIRKCCLGQTWTDVKEAG